MVDNSSFDSFIGQIEKIFSSIQLLADRLKEYYPKMCRVVNEYYFKRYLPMLHVVRAPRFKSYKHEIGKIVTRS